MSWLQDLPSELLANIILFADWHCLWASDEKWADLLALRAASKPCKEAVRLSIKDHRACANIGFGGTNTRAIAAVGRVFGRGCAKLSYYGNHNHSSFPIDVVNPLRDFVVLETRGRLRALEVNHSAITAPALEAMCIMDLPAIAPGDVLRLARGCPRLTALDYSLDPVDSDDELPPLDKNLSVADQSHIADLFDLLDSRCREANIPPRFQIKLLV